MNILLAIGIFCGAVPLAKHGTSWKSWRDKGTDELNASYNLNGIVSSIDAASVSTSCIFLTITTIDYSKGIPIIISLLGEILFCLKINESFLLYNRMLILTAKNYLTLISVGPN